MQVKHSLPSFLLCLIVVALGFGQFQLSLVFRTLESPLPLRRIYCNLQSIQSSQHTSFRACVQFAFLE
ncbi:TPA: hypothetical protein ACOEO9_000726 [Stenotrophomonas maltophilia]